MCTPPLVVNALVRVAPCLSRENWPCDSHMEKGVSRQNIRVTVFNLSYNPTNNFVRKESERATF